MNKELSRPSAGLGISAEGEALFDRAKAIYNDPFSPQDVKNAKLNTMALDLRKLRDELKVKIDGSEEHGQCLMEIIEWARKPLVLESNDCTRLHKVAAAIRDGTLLGDAGVKHIGDSETVVDKAQSFVVQHDWTAAFTGATDFDDGEWHLPYPHCAFEFRISGRSVIVVALEHESLKEQFGSPQAAIIFVQSMNRWVSLGMEGAKRCATAGDFLWKQVRAISIALDAEVATREIVRAPAALNARRQKANKLPLYDFHVVRLSSRHRRAPFDGGGTGTRKRLHFRRGHWRHFPTFKTWIKWTLVGDPALGFIDKEYRA